MQTSSAKLMENPSSPRLKSAIAVVLFGTSSALILFVNRKLMKVFPFAMVLMLVQMTFSVVVLSTLKFFGQITFLDFTLGRAKQVVLLTLCYAADVALGITGLRLVHIPMYTSLRRMSIGLVVIAELFLLKKIPTKVTVVAVCVMLAGSVISGWTDLGFSLFGYSIVLLNNITTSVYRVLVKRVEQETKLDTFGIMFYNSVMTIPLILLVTFLTGEVFEVLNAPNLMDGNVLYLLAMSSIQAFALNYSMFLCTLTTSPLTTSIVGQLKNTAVFFGSLFLFAEMQASTLNIAGHSLSLFGGVVYALQGHLRSAIDFLLQRTKVPTEA